MYWLIFFLFIHWVFDYFCQTRAIADTKYINMSNLWLHTLGYSVGLTIMAAVIAFSIGLTYQIAQFVVVNLVAHGLTDFFTSKATHVYYEKKMYYQFFNVLGIDQLLHISVLLLTAQWFLKLTIAWG